jgi:hypothetical protein
LRAHRSCSGAGTGLRDDGKNLETLCIARAPAHTHTHTRARAPRAHTHTRVREGTRGATCSGTRQVGERQRRAGVVQFGIQPVLRHQAWTGTPPPTGGGNSTTSAAPREGHGAN